MRISSESFAAALERLPEPLRPLDQEPPRLRRRVRRFEAAILVIAAVGLAVATIHDLVREVNLGIRLHADLVSWERITGATYHNPLIEQDVKHYTTKDTVCADTENVKPKGSTLVCLIFVGPVRHGLRRAVGGYYLVAEGTDVHEPVLNDYQYRYGCFGRAATEGLCGMPTPPGAPDKPLVR
jgi:hypothetical protein